MDYIVGIIFLILSGIFAWESTMIVHEQKKKRKDK